MSVFRRILSKIDRKYARFASVKTGVGHFKKPIVSFSFDDCPHTAMTAGARLLEEKGAVGTFYVCGGLTDGTENGLPCQTEQDLSRTHENGHELASHLYNHRRCEDLSYEELVREIQQSKCYLEAWLKDEEELHFSYPFGSINLQAKKQISTEFISGRGVEPGINSGRIDMACLKAVALYERQVSKEKIREWIDCNVSQDGWLIFYTHDVSDTPSEYGITPDMLRYAIEYSIEKGCDLMSVKAASRFVSLL